MLSSAMAMDKAVSKKLFEHAGIPTPAWRLYRRREGRVPDDALASALGGYPLVVKPNDEGSTFGLSIVETPRPRSPPTKRRCATRTRCWSRPFIPGRELTVAVLGEQVLPIVEIKPKSGLYDYESKYTAGQERVLLPGRPRRRQNRRGAGAVAARPAMRSTPRASRASTSASRPTARPTASRSTRSPA
jgi:D-alanine-D-alanine ligase